MRSYGKAMKGMDFKLDFKGELVQLLTKFKSSKLDQTSI